MTQKLIIHGKLPSYNLFYGGVHWSKRKALADEWHKMVFYECKNQKIKPIRNPVFLEFDIKFSGSGDADNFCLKVLIDGLVKAEILRGDDYRFVRSYMVNLEKVKDFERIIIRLIELEL